MIHSAPRADSSGEKSIDEAAVKIQAFHVWRTSSGWLNPWPRNRKSIALHVQLFRQSDVLLIEVVLIAGDVARYSSSHFAGSMGEPVPDRFAFSIYVPCAFISDKTQSQLPRGNLQENAPL